MLPSYLTSWTPWLDLLPLPLIAAVPSIGLALLAPGARGHFWHSFVLLYGMAILGITTGVLTGQSSEPAITAVVPAVLGLVGGVSVYLLGAKSADHQSVVALVLTVFSLNLLVGVFCGAKLRSEYDDYANSEQYKMYREMVEQNVRLQSLVYEKQLREARTQLGLPRVQDTAVDKKASAVAEGSKRRAAQ